MKNKILTFIIGMLIGAIITSIGFIIYIKTNNTDKRPNFGTPPQMNQGQNFNKNGGTPPKMPSGEKPSENSNNGATNGNNENPTRTQNNSQVQSNS